MTDGQRDREIFSKKLRAKFEEKDITQQYLSELSGVPTWCINNYLHGRTLPTGGKLEKLAEALDTTVEEIWWFD